MSRRTKYISLVVLVLFVLACNAVTQPFNQAKDPGRDRPIHCHSHADPDAAIPSYPVCHPGPIWNA